MSRLFGSNETRELREIKVVLVEILHELRKQNHKPKAISAFGYIKTKGDSMNPATLALNGNGGQYVQTEFDGPNGTGNQVANIGPMSYASDDASVATVDAATGVIKPVAVGTCNVSATDAGNNLTSTVALTVTDAAVSAVGSIEAL